MFDEGVDPWPRPDVPRVVTATEGHYVMLPCGDNIPMIYGDSNFMWYFVENQKDTIPIQEDDRKFVDAQGEEINLLTCIHNYYLKKNKVNRMVERPLWQLRN